MTSDFLLAKPPFHPFGTGITCEQIQAQLSAAHCWEDKYRQIIQWGKLLPALEDGMKNPLTIAGCESQVTLYFECHAGRFYFAADSDARIVKGLLAIILAAVEGKSAKQILAFDFSQYFEQGALLEQLSATRAAGVNAIIQQIMAIATA